MPMPHATMRRAAPTALALATAVALVGCGTSGDRDIGTVCPRVVVLKEASEVTEPLTTDPAAVSFTARVADTLGDCEFRGDIVEVGLEVGLRVRYGAGAPPEIMLPVFIAATETDTQVISRTVREVRVALPAGQAETYVTLPEEEIKIAVAEGRKAWNYEIVVGLVLSDAQLAFNRRHGRF